jgi:pimeloyl-ACP methyl ester carboxylesterase
MSSVVTDSVALPNGERIHYRRREGGEIPVVCLHGNFASSLYWDVVFERMDDRFALYAMDLRGFGDSSYEGQIDSIADLAADVPLFADAVGLDTVHLWGWSLGAAVAMQVAADIPERVGRQVLMAPPSTQGLPVYEKDANMQPTERPLTTRPELAADPVSVEPSRRAIERGDAEAAKEVWRRAIFVHGPPAPDRFDAYAEESLKQRNPVDVAYALVHFNISDEHDGVGPGTGEAGDITAETLVVRGEDDLIVTREMSERIIADLEHARLLELEDCGHAPQIDALDELLERVEPFLDIGLRE